ncbi:hypothetical protein GRI40_01060 [Altererythrobacter aerius]|uniref:Uncharacterized protein n=1 Tax=Tsuneonella aeria TaxID=1837929 RepID=A0A6I4T9M1_9SPHN|nr:hypothetical protein [Tsuneonella aeria]MXO73813.1 hypothetical protein [Tsuneonella aeria]
MMAPSNWQEWVAWAGIVIPLAVLAWTAWKFTADRSEQRKHRRCEHFFSVTDKIAQSEGSLLSRVAALYELRRFPEYSEVIVRMTEAPEIVGGGRAKAVLQQEFRLTQEAMKKDA